MLRKIGRESSIIYIYIIVYPFPPAAEIRSAAFQKAQPSHAHARCLNFMQHASSVLPESDAAAVHCGWEVDDVARITEALALLIHSDLQLIFNLSLLLNVL